jgi:hypothetical protein
VGTLDFSLSTPVEKRYPRGTTTEHRGLFFAPSSWDKSAIFMPANRIGYIFISESAKHSFDKFQDSNIDLEPLENVQLDAATRLNIEEAAP